MDILIGLAMILFLLSATFLCLMAGILIFEIIISLKKGYKLFR